MQVRNMIIRLMLCVACGLPYPVFADSYCPVTDDGKIWIDQCIYSSNAECKKASGTKGDCVPDQLSSSNKAPYCLILGSIMGSSEICDKYQDYESCEQDAKKQAGNCIKNINYQGADK